MDTILVVAVFVVLISVLAGLIQVWRGPTPADRMLSALLFGTGGVAILLLLAEVAAQPAFVDVALVLAILALIVSVAFVRNDRLETESET